MKARRITKAVFPVAGFGTRFLPMTKALPKEMLPIVDTPVLQLLAEQAAASGIEDIILVTGRGKRAIEDHFDASYELEQTLVEYGKHDLLRDVERIASIARFSYVRQPRPLGDGDAILRASHLVGDEPFAVVFGDDLVDNDPPILAQMIAAYEERPGVYIAVQEVALDAVHSYGIIDPASEDGHRRIEARGLVEKPKPEDTPSRLGITGTYILPPSIFGALERARDTVTDELRLIDGMRILLEEGAPVWGYRFEGTRYDIGSKLGFLRATIDFALKRPELAPALLAHIRSRLVP